MKIKYYIARWIGSDNPSKAELLPICWHKTMEEAFNHLQEMISRESEGDEMFALTVVTEENLNKVNG